MPLLRDNCKAGIAAQHTHAPASVHPWVKAHHNSAYRLSQTAEMCIYRCVVGSRASRKGSFNSILEGLEISLIGDRQSRLVGLSILNKFSATDTLFSISGCLIGDGVCS